MIHLIMYLIIYLRMRYLGAKISVPKDLYPNLLYSRDFAYPHIEYKFPYFYYVVAERGEEQERCRFISLNDLMYKIFNSITFDMASSYEVKHRVENQDFRRVLFSYQIDLISAVSKKWKDRLEAEIEEILKENPYVDITEETRSLFYDQANSLKGKDLIYHKYVYDNTFPYHNYCKFCMRKFDGNGSDFQYGYSTKDNSIWICEKCFNELKKYYGFTADSDKEK